MVGFGCCKKEGIRQDAGRESPLELDSFSCMQEGRLIGFV